MTLSVTFRCNREPPSKATARLKGIAQVDGNQIQFTADQGDLWSQVFEVLEENHLTFSSPIQMANTFFPSHRWGRPDEDWCGAILDNEDMELAGNPLGDYVPPVRPPEIDGYVPFEKGLITRAKPAGQLIAVGENRIFSSELVAQLGGQIVGRFGGDVIYQAERLREWHRFEPISRCRLLDPMSVLPVMPCGACGASHYPTLGVWIAASDEIYAGPFAFDEIGFDHYAIKHPMVISVDQARKIDKRFRGKGYSLDPVLKSRSSVSTLAKAIFNAWRKIEKAKKKESDTMKTGLV